MINKPVRSPTKVRPRFRFQVQAHFTLIGLENGEMELFMHQSWVSSLISRKSK